MSLLRSFNYLLVLSYIINVVLDCKIVHIVLITVNTRGRFT